MYVRERYVLGLSLLLMFNLFFRRTLFAFPAAVVAAGCFAMIDIYMLGLIAIQLSLGITAPLDTHTESKQ